MSGSDRWSVRVYSLYRAGCGQVSQKSFIALEVSDRLPRDHRGVSINVANDYGPARLKAIAESLGSVRHILRERKKGDQGVAGFVGPRLGRIVHAASVARIKTRPLTRQHRSPR
jgi:hypothetical protein